MAPEPITSSTTFSADAYRNLADLLDVGRGRRLKLVGSLQAQTAAFTYRLGDRTTPAATDPGFTVAAGGSYDTPERLELAWPVELIWVRNAAAGVNTTLLTVGLLVEA